LTGPYCLFKIQSNVQSNFGGAPLTVSQQASRQNQAIEETMKQQWINAAIAAGILSLGCVGIASAQDFPNHTVRIIVLSRAS
jgi:hypothetical protein